MNMFLKAILAVFLAINSSASLAEATVTESVHFYNETGTPLTRVELNDGGQIVIEGHPSAEAVRIKVKLLNDTLNSLGVTSYNRAGKVIIRTAPSTYRTYTPAPSSRPSYNQRSYGPRPYRPTRSESLQSG